MVVAKTYAARDCKLDSSAIEVTVGWKAVEAYWDECAQKLKDGDFSSAVSMGAK